MSHFLPSNVLSYYLFTASCWILLLLSRFIGPVQLKGLRFLNDKEIGKKKKEEYSPFVTDSLAIERPSSENGLIAFPKKARSITVFKPGSLGQNAIALPLAPPQPPNSFSF